MSDKKLSRRTVDRHEPFLRSEALSTGWDVARRPAGLHQVFKGVWISRETAITLRVRVLAALVLHHETAFASHQSAASLRRLPVPSSARTHISVIEQGHRTHRLDIAVHLACRESLTEKVDGIEMSEPLDLFIELAGELPLVDLVVVGDAMVKRGMFTAQELRSFCSSTSRRHVRKARRAATYVREGVDSPMETRLRMLIVLAGLPEPKVNVKIYFEDGRERFRLDLAYPGVRVLIEYDGRQHAESSAQWNSDIERREELEVEGWTVIVVTSDGIYKHPEKTVVRVARALRRRGYPVPPMREDWRAHLAG